MSVEIHQIFAHRMSKKKVSKADGSAMLSLPVLNSHAAGVDVGSRFHMVAVGQDKEKEVRSFGVTTPDLHELCQFLQAQGVQRVAMESTGYYWIPLFWMLQSYGFEAIVVNPGDIKRYNKPKSDPEDARWIQQLHALGLLKPSFQMDNFGDSLRAFVRRRRNILDDCNRHMNRMHKVLVLMNVQVGTQLTDLGGASGMDIVRDIVGGQRDPQMLLGHIRQGVKSSRAELLKALQGTWQPQYLFELKQLLAAYDLCTAQLGDCDQEVEQLLEHWHTENNRTPPQADKAVSKAERKAVKGKNLPPLHTTRMLSSMLGLDLLQIQGMSGGTLLEIIAETGTDLSQFPSAKHYASWLGLAPNHRKSGGKTLSSHVPKRPNRAKNAFKMAANAIGRCKEHPYKAFFANIQRKQGWKGAITATARKLAVAYWHMVTQKEAFNPVQAEEYLKKRREATLKKIQKSIKELDFSQEELFRKAA